MSVKSNTRMDQRHLEVIALGLHASLNKRDDDIMQLRAWAMIVSDMAEHLAAHNKLFDRDKFKNMAMTGRK